MAATTRASIWLAAIGIAAFQVVGSFGAADNQPERKAIDAIAVVLVLLGPAALAVRDRWPLVPVPVSIAAASVYIALGYPFGPIFVSVAVALFTAVLAGRRRETWVLAAAGYLVFLAAYVADPRGGPPSWLHFALVAGWTAAILALADVVRARKQQADEAKQREVDERRLHLAQELHDVLAHNISLINVQASVALHLLDDQPEQARPALTTIKKASHDALGELRTALDVLRRGDGAPRSPAPRLDDVEELAAGLRGGGVEVHVTRTGRDRSLPAAVELAAYRIVQEALTNVTRHARATRADVRLTIDEHSLRVEITDDGVGGLPSAGNGLVGMRERAASVGGSLDAGPQPGGGFRVAAHLPVETP